MESSNPIVKQVVLAKLNGSQNKTNSHESGKKLVGVGGERLLRLRNRWEVADHSQNILHTCINYQKINFLKLNKNKNN